MGASYRSAVPINVSLPTANRPPVRVRTHGSPVTARLALFYAARLRDAARVADSAPISRREGRTTRPEDSRETKNSGQLTAHTDRIRMGGPRVNTGGNLPQ